MLNLTLHFLLFLTEKQNHCICPFVLVSNRMYKSYSFAEILKYAQKYLTGRSQVARLETAIELQVRSTRFFDLNWPIPIHLSQQPKIVICSSGHKPSINELAPKFTHRGIIYDWNGHVPDSFSCFGLYLDGCLSSFSFLTFLSLGRWLWRRKAFQGFMEWSWGFLGSAGIKVGVILIGVFLFFAGLVVVLLKVLVELFLGEVYGFFLVVVESFKPFPLVLVPHYKCSLIFIAYTEQIKVCNNLLYLKQKQKRYPKIITLPLHARKRHQQMMLYMLQLYCQGLQHKIFFVFYLKECSCYPYQTCPTPWICERVKPHQQLLLSQGVSQQVVRLKPENQSLATYLLTGYKVSYTLLHVYSEQFSIVINRTTS